MPMVSASFDGKTDEIQDKMVLVTFKRKSGILTMFGASRVIVMLGANGELDGASTGTPQSQVLRKEA